MKRILIIEDDKYSRIYFATALRKQGYECDVVSCTDKAYTFIESNIYNLILLDLFLPMHSGLGFLKEISEKYPKQSILVVTATNYKEIPFDFSKYTVLRKPVGINELTTAVERNMK